MWGARYWGMHYFGTRYWGKTGAVSVAAVMPVRVDARTIALHQADVRTVILRVVDTA